LEEGNGEADDGGRIAGKEGDEGLVESVLEAIGSSFATPEIGIEISFELFGGEAFHFANSGGIGEAEILAAQKAEPCDDNVGLAQEGLEHAAGVGAVGGLVENLAFHSQNNRVSGEDEVADTLMFEAQFVLDGDGLHVGEIHRPQMEGNEARPTGGFFEWRNYDFKGDIGLAQKFNAARGGGGEDEAGEVFV
jgi:hypothetical protein